MNLLKFVNTNIGVVAVRRHEHAESLYYSQVWLRREDGDWRQHHLLSRERDMDISPGMLESLYQSVTEEQLPYEDWW